MQDAPPSAQPEETPDAAMDGDAQEDEDEEEEEVEAQRVKIVCPRFRQAHTKCGVGRVTDMSRAAARVDGHRRLV